MRKQILWGMAAVALGTAVVGMVLGEAPMEPATVPAGPRQQQPLQPYPNEIPVPPLKTNLPSMPGVNELPVRPGMPDVMTMNDGTKVTTPEQWAKRREEMRQILEYYGTGRAPPAPGNVKGEVLSTQMLADGKVKYRLVRLTFGPESQLTLHVGIYEPAEGGPFPTVVMAGAGSPRGAPMLKALPPEQGLTGDADDILLHVGPSTQPAGGRGGRGGRGAGLRGGRGAGTQAGTQPGTQPGGARGGLGRGPGGFAPPTPPENGDAIQHGFAYVTFNTNECAEDTRLRLADGSWAFRTTRFFPAYPGYDWGIIRAWGWGASRIVDYLQTDPSIDKSKLIISGVSRWGKCALFIGAFDDRFSMVAPVASSGGGTPAFRFSGPEHGGHEGLTDMMRKYPNQFSPNLHQFWGHIDQLPFDENWYMALVAPRPFIALEGLSDGNVNHNGVRQSIRAAKPAYELLGVPDQIGVWWTERPHGIRPGDWQGMLGFADKFLLHKPVDLKFDQFPADAYPEGSPK